MLLSVIGAGSPVSGEPGPRERPVPALVHGGADEVRGPIDGAETTSPVTRHASRWFDRPYAGAVIALAAGPLQAPPVEDLRRAVAELLRAAPDGPAALVVRDGLAVRRHAMDVEALAARLVVPTAPLPPLPDPATALADLCVTQPPLTDGAPFRLAVGPDNVILSMQHVVGDAGVANALLAGLVLTALGQGLPEPLVAPTTPGVARSVLRTMTRSLRSVPRTHPVTAPTRPGEVWQPVHGLSHLSLVEPALRHLKLRARALGVRRSSLLVALVDRALAQHGLPAADDVRNVVVDCRRYLPAGSVVRGNFSAGAAMTADWADPLDVDATITTSLERARPLLHLVAGSVQSRLPGGPVRPLAATGPVRVHPDYSVVGPVRWVGSLPWTGVPNYVSTTRPYRPDGLGVIACEVRSVLQVSIGYDAAVVDPAAVDAALAGLGDLLRDPPADDAPAG